MGHQYNLRSRIFYRINKAHLTLGGIGSPPKGCEQGRGHLKEVCTMMAAGNAVEQRGDAH